MKVQVSVSALTTIVKVVEAPLFTTANEENLHIPIAVGALAAVLATNTLADPVAVTTRFVEVVVPVVMTGIVTSTPGVNESKYPVGTLLVGGEAYVIAALTADMRPVAAIVKVPEVAATSLMMTAVEVVLLTFTATTVPAAGCPVATNAPPCRVIVRRPAVVAALAALIFIS